jgi:hypothetical protein
MGKPLRVTQEEVEDVGADECEGRQEVPLDNIIWTQIRAEKGRSKNQFGRKYSLTPSLNPSFILILKICVHLRPIKSFQLSENLGAGTLRHRVLAWKRGV